MKVKKGARRWVFITKKYAFKIPSLSSFECFIEGLIHNISEGSFSELQLPELCPIIFRIPGGFLNVMPKCECGIWPGWDEKDCEMLDKWVEKAEKSEHSRLLLKIVERKEDSVGRLKNGKIVAVDYGSPFVKIISK